MRLLIVATLGLRLFVATPLSAQVGSALGELLKKVSGVSIEVPSPAWLSSDASVDDNGGRFNAVRTAGVEFLIRPGPADLKSPATFEIGIGYRQIWDFASASGDYELDMTIQSVPRVSVMWSTGSINSGGALAARLFARSFAGVTKVTGGTVHTLVEVTSDQFPNDPGKRHIYPVGTQFSVEGDSFEFGLSGGVEMLPTGSPVSVAFELGLTELSFRGARWGLPDGLLFLPTFLPRNLALGHSFGQLSVRVHW